jgi:hypothetical protein
MNSKSEIFSIVDRNLRHTCGDAMALAKIDFAAKRLTFTKSAFNVTDLDVLDPSLLAAMLYKDFKRDDDDATAVIMRYLDNNYVVI